MLFVLSLAILPMAYYVYSSLSSDVGMVKCRKGKLTVNTTSGLIRLPHVKLPSYDWDVHFFTDKSVFNQQDGLHDSSVMDSFQKQSALVIRNILVCEHLYPEDIGTGVKCVINSPFDNVCYVHSLEPNRPIDYRLLCNEFATKIEEM